MSETLPACPKCASEFTYEMGALLVCPECGHEWQPQTEDSAGEGDSVIRDAVGNVLVDGDDVTVVKVDAVGNVLVDGDDVTVVKALKVKGVPGGIKAGTKVRNIRLVAGVGDHDIDCRIDGIGAMQLKSSVVKKA